MNTQRFEIRDPWHAPETLTLDQATKRFGHMDLIEPEGEIVADWLPLMCEGDRLDDIGAVLDDTVDIVCIEGDAPPVPADERENFCSRG